MTELTMDTLPFADTSVDTFIASRLPAWLTNATAEQLTALQQALAEQQRAREAVQALLRQIQPLDTFASTLLSEALARKVQPPLDVRLATLRRAVHIRYPSSVGLAPDGIVPVTFEQSLLACALHNFTLHETAETAWLQNSTLLDAQAQPVAWRPRAFAGLCRSLDIGGAYQQHLKQVLLADNTRRHQTEAVLEEGWRARLVAAAHMACAQGDLDARAVALVTNAVRASIDSAGWAANDVRLLGRQMCGLVVFEEHDDASTLQRIVAWVPDDPAGAMRTYASWAQWFSALGARLRDPGYRRFFERFIKEQDRVPFSQALQRLLGTGGAQDAIELDGRWQRIEGPLCAHLRQVQVDTLLGDAQALAVPTTKVDSVERDRRMHWLKGVGLDALGIASFFVPGLALPLLGLTAVQLADEVYEGYQDWTLGDREAALAHLMAVAESVAMMAGGAAAEAVAVKLAARVAAVDDLAPVRLWSGELRLARTDLPGYAEPEQTLAHGQRGTLQGRLHVSISNRAYPLGDDNHVPTVIHPSRPDAPAITLHDNGVSGVRHGLERPQDWQGAGLLVRRLGSNLGAVSDALAKRLLRTVAMNENQVRLLHLDNAPAPARLCDAAQRHELHEWFPRLRGEAFEAHWQHMQGTPSRAAQPLHRDFPTLSTRAGRALVEHASGSQLSQLLEQQRVPLAMAEQARWLLRDARLDRACAGFEQPAAVTTDTEQLALGLVDELAPWPAGVQVQVRDARLQGDVLARVGSTTALETRCLIRTPQGYLATDSEGVARPGALASDDLFQALLWHLDAEQRQAVAGADASSRGLASALADRASADRDQAATLLAMAPVAGGVRPPRRLGDGRLGYPLSGRAEGSRRALLHGYQQVFPTLKDVDVEAYLETVRLRGDTPWEHLRHLHQCLLDLNESLAAWRREATAAPLAERRRQIARRIRHCWRRKRPDADGQYRLVIDSERIDSLPVLPEAITFEHVSQVSIRRAHLHTITPGFLQRFTQVQALDLSENLLGGIPDGLQALTQLTTLSLARNQVVIDEAGLARLAALQRLRTLDLSYNPIALLPPLGSLLNLQRLSLRSTGLTELPVEVYMHPTLEDIDLRDNRVEDMSPTLAHSHRRLAGLSLHDNAIPDEAQQTLRETLGAQGTAMLPVRRHGPGGQESLERWLDGLDATQRGVREMHWAQLSQEPGSDDLMRFIHDLGRSADYEYQGMDLRRRIWALIEACVENTEVRQAMFQQAAGPRTCSDQMLLILSLLEVRALVVTRIAGLAASDIGPALVQLGRELYRLDEVDRVASQHIEQARAANPYGLHDEVEVHLAYRAALVRPLGLPAQPRYMYHRLFSDVSEAQLQQAASTILSQETDTKVAQSLLERPFWVDYLHATCAKHFEVLNQPYHDRLEALLEQTQASAEKTTLDAIGTLAEERARAERKLMLGLTLQWVMGHPWVGSA